MKYIKDGKFLILKLDSEEDLFKGIERALKEEGISSAMVLTGIGMLKNFTIGYYDGRDYVKRSLETPHELVALHGSIASDPEDFRFHLHTALANPEHNIIGGHLFEAKVNVVAEITLLTLNREIIRKRDEKSGLMLMDFLD